MIAQTASKVRAILSEFSGILSVESHLKRRRTRDIHKSVYQWGSEGGGTAVSCFQEEGDTRLVEWNGRRRLVRYWLCIGESG
jgi:hypothetical protein